MATDAQVARRGWSAMPGSLRIIWALLTNVKFALLLVGTATAASTVGIVIPQVPVEMRNNPAARSAWLELRQEDYGVFTGLMDRFDLFDIFRSPWFVGLWVLILVAVTVCTVSRLRPTWRTVERPPLRVADGYFDTARHRASFSHKGGAEAVTALLRKKHFRVVNAGAEIDAEYLLAERFQWTQYGTFLSHLALLLLLVGAILTSLAGFQRTLALADGGSPYPVFRTPRGDQIFLTMVDAVRGIDADGNIVDFHSDVEISRGDQTVSCTITVNGPCEAFGYRFHQAAFFDDLAALTVRDTDGRLLFDDVLDFNNGTAVVPFIRVTDADGRVRFDQMLPQMSSLQVAQAGPAVALSQLVVPLSDGELHVFIVSWQQLEGEVVLSVTGGGADASGLRAGQETRTPDGVSIAYVGPVAIPAITVRDLPGAGAEGPTVVQMVKDGRGDDYLYITGVGEQGLVVTEGEPATGEAGIEYAFGGRLDASGIDVRRDPGDTFIWVAIIGALIGLVITFWIPSRRFWVKVTPGRTYLAGAAERTARMTRELEQLGVELRDDPGL